VRGSQASTTKPQDTGDKFRHIPLMHQNSAIIIHIHIDCTTQNELPKRSKHSINTRLVYIMDCIPEPQGSPRDTACLSTHSEALSMQEESYEVSYLLTPEDSHADLPYPVPSHNDNHNVVGLVCALAGVQPMGSRNIHGGMRI